MTSSIVTSIPPRRLVSQERRAARCGYVNEVFRRVARDAGKGSGAHASRHQGRAARCDPESELLGVDPVDSADGDFPLLTSRYGCLLAQFPRVSGWDQSRHARRIDHRRRENRLRRSLAID
jgi:hypothetical protein